MCWWPTAVTISRPFLNHHRIFPTAQRDCEVIVCWAEEQPLVKRVVIFGSAITTRFCALSDIDFCVFGEGTDTIIELPNTEHPFDMWHYCRKHLNPEHRL